MPYWRTYYHIVWSTKHRQPTITGRHERYLYRFMRIKAQELGVHIYALNGVQDHVHLIVRIPPKLTVSNVVGQLKGYSSARYNKEIRQPGEPRFKWQRLYAVFTFSDRALSILIGYVRWQKQHHKKQKLIKIMEDHPKDDDPRFAMKEI